MKTCLMKHILPVLLALALLIAAAPHSAVQAEAAPTSSAEPETVQKEAKSAPSKGDIPVPSKGDSRDVDFSEIEAIDLKPGAELELAFSEDQYEIWLRFVPLHTGFYTFASSGDVDVFVELWNGDGEWLGGDDDSGEGYNFCIRHFLDADQTYYYCLGSYSYMGSDQTPFTVLLTEEEGGMSGFCGAEEDNLTWSFDLETGVLTIEGRGAMDDFFEWNGAPWNPLRNYIQAVELPDGLTYIGDYAFNSLPNLTEITIPQSVSVISDFVFDSCSSLQTVTFPDHMTYIGQRAFYYCKALTSAVVPEGITVLQHCTFAECDSLASVSLPETLTEIRYQAFEQCTALTSVSIPENVTEIGNAAFAECTALTSVTIPEGVREISYGAFNGCTNLREVQLPESVTVIGEYAFYGCGRLASLDLPAGVVRIETGAFEGCSALDMLVIRRADCLVGFLSSEYDPGDTEEDLDYELDDRTLGTPKTIIYGRHDPEHESNHVVDDRYLYAEAYALSYGYRFYDLYAFTDVQEYSWYEIPVAWANGMGITSGVGGGKFAPKASCLREQVMTFLWAAAGKPEPESMENPFTDVNLNKYYAKAVLWAWQNGVTGGMSETVFGVGKACTRAQVVTFLYGAAGKPEPESMENPFTDVKETDYFYKAVLWAVENGVTGGTSPTTFSPKQTCTRAQVVTFLYAASKAMEPEYVRADDDEVYGSVFGEYAALMEQARSADSADERFLLSAQAEAALLDTGAVFPAASQGGVYALSRVAPHTRPHAAWGMNSYRLNGLVISEDFLTRAEHAELDALWAAAAAGNGTYDPAAYLTGKGHRINRTYSAPVNDPATLDWLEADSENQYSILANLVDGLVEYDNLGDLHPALAESWEVSADGLTWTFHLREGVNWYTSEGEVWSELTANDFVAGFRHMLDCQSASDYLAGEGYAEIVGVEAYLWDEGSFDDVGCRALGDHTLVYTLNKPVPSFLSMLTHNTFLPICDSFYQSRGGAYGIDELWESILSGSYDFAESREPASQVYCGPFLVQSCSGWEIVCVKNNNYYRADTVTLRAVKWTLDDWYQDDIYDKAVAGIYTEVELNDAYGLVDRAREDGLFDACACPTELNCVTYFETLNLDRGAFALEDGACASWKSEKQKIDAAAALLNRNFRKALQHAFDKTSYYAAAKDEETAAGSLRNMLTPPDFVKLTHAVTDAEGHSFPAGTFYGEMVQYYCDQRGCAVDVADGQDGWYKPETARACLAAAREELGGSVSWPIRIDMVYFSGSSDATEKAYACKQSIEETLGAENVTVNLIRTSEYVEYLDSCYYLDFGRDANYDLNTAVGWGADFGEPFTYLDIFDRSADGYSLRFCGLY